MQGQGESGADVLSAELVVDVVALAVELEDAVGGGLGRLVAVKDLDEVRGPTTSDV